MPNPIRVFLVDDSPTVRRILAVGLSRDPGLRLVGAAASGEEALERLPGLAPDVVTLDLEMPGIGGLAALERILELRSTAVVLLSGVGGRAIRDTVEGLARGAVDFVTKYRPGLDTDPAELSRELIAKIRIAARAKAHRAVPGGSIPAVLLPATERRAIPSALEVFVVGASTGGPAAIRELLSALPKTPRFGILLVQHLPVGFTEILADSLARQTGRAVREARDGDRLGEGAVLVAPGNRHATVTRSGRIRLGDEPKVNGFRPAIDVAMISAATAFGPRSAGALLTGMGEDGARGLAAIRAAGGRTFAQNEATCAVYGMPLRAVELGAVCEVDTPAGIAGRFFRIGDSR